MQAVSQIISSRKELSDLPELKNVPEVPIKIDAFLQMQLEWQNSMPGNMKYGNCKKCLNRGYSYILVGKELVAKECDCMRTRRCMKNMELSGLGDLIQRSKFDNYFDDEVWQSETKQKIMQFVKSPSEWLFVGGQKGAGKTHLCTAACKKLLATGREVRYEKWLTLYNKLDGLRYKHDERENFLRELEKVDVLYIDDFLQFEADVGQKPSAHMLELAFEIINDRYNCDNTTIISSVWYDSEIIGFKEDLGDRIRHRAGNNIVTILRKPGRNYRLRQDK